MCPDKLPDPILITRPAALQRLADTLLRQDVVAVDTESNSLYVYREQVCLVQFSTLEADYLVDPLALGDLSVLGELFSNPGIEKVFHAAEYDLICLRRDFGFEFANLFDTMLAARILGREAVGLGSMLEQTFGVQLDKRHQRADWGQRPLPLHLLSYARLDTHYLIELRNNLETELRQKELWELALEDFRRMGSLKTIEDDGRAPQEDVEVSCWRVSGAHDLTPQQAAILLELCRYRDQMARQHNRPLFKIINDYTLIAIATQAPKSLDELGRLPGMSRGQVRRHGNALLQAVQRGLHAAPIYPPRSPRPDEQFSERLEGLRRWRKAAALEMGVPSDIVLPRDLLITLAESNPRQPESLAEALSDTPWRRERFGEQILQVLRKPR
jgi:ribonuclease D